MEIRLKLGGVVFHFILAREVEIEQELLPFIVYQRDTSDIDIFVSWEWKLAKMPKTKALGNDLIQNYYREEKINYCVVLEGKKGAISSTYYSDSFQELRCFINEKPFLNSPHSLGHILRFMPMRAIFQHFGVLFFHAAQIALGEKGILFTGPSGIGKTTQAKLWVTYENARLICNDRVLIRRDKYGWKTYGYPIDGSTPVGSSEVHTLCCIVLLAQSKENRLVKLSSIQAISRLMSQQVIDVWNPKAHTRSMELLTELLAEIPVYQLFCTSEKQAADYLKNQLREEGVIGNGEY